MSETFGAVYADAYDALYGEKDYTAECELIERVFRTYGQGQMHTVLDLGCGTGGHALILAQRGYQVTGVDRSEAMLAHAQKKVDELRLNGQITFAQGDIRNLSIDAQFDAAVMMFAVLGYQVANADVLAALRSVRRHLRPGGLFLFDVWYGPAVLHLKPSERVKVVSSADATFLRVAAGDLDVGQQTCTVRYRMWHLSGKQVIAETQESHVVRYFFPQELAFLLECAGFTLIRLGTFPELDHEPDETTWNVLGVAQPV